MWNNRKTFLTHIVKRKKAVTEEHVENYHIYAGKKKRKSGTHCTYTEVCIGKGSMNTQDKETGQIINREFL